MTIQDALQMYKIPYTVTETIDGGGYVSCKLSPRGAQATPQRLSSRLEAMSIALGQHLEMVMDGVSLYIRYRSNVPFYDYFRYNGHIDFDDPALPYIVGFNEHGLVMDSMANASHMLVAGTTGSGKSVFLHNLIYSFACNAHSHLLLVDCKESEFTVYNEMAMVTGDVFGEKSCATFADFMVNKMIERSKRMAEENCSDFADWQKLHPQERRFVMVVDELNDLLSDKNARKTIIPQFLRIAQRGRSAGIHIILATQRPDHTVINGTLKGNLPTRMAFKAISAMDSRIILDRTGAERLTGRGDGLYLRNASLQLERVQAPFISVNTVLQHEAS